MNAYLIENTTSGIILGTYTAADEDAAWQACVEDAGYQGHEPEAQRGADIEITEVAS